jgi:nucleoid-associated protein YgaU
MALVMAVAVVFFRQEAAPAGAAPNEASMGVRGGRHAPPPARPSYRSFKAKTASRPKAAAEATPSDAPAGRRHTVAEGETLFTLAQRYYGDGARFADLYQANKDALSTPDNLPPGTVLVIPEAAAEGQDDGQ